MSVQQRRKYDSEFKRNAVLLTEEPGRTVPEVTESLGITSAHIPVAPKISKVRWTLFVGQFFSVVKLEFDFFYRGNRL
jgi:hypothetical protein